MANKINFSDIHKAAGYGHDEVKQVIDEILDVCPVDDPPYLSDVLTTPKGGPALQIRLGMEANKRSGKRFMWKIKVLCDEYGTPPKQGDVVSRTIREAHQVYSDELKHTLHNTADMNVAIVSDSFNGEYNTRIDFIVDEKGCIECAFDDAHYFLFGYGVHGRTGKVINPQRALRVTATPSRMKSGPHAGQMKHIHYWRYKEVDNEQYEALEPLEIPQAPDAETPAKETTAPKRGRKKAS